MTRMRRAAVYVAVVAAVLAPGFLRVGGGIPGSPHADLWNSLWTFWQVAHHGLSFRVTDLGFPDGGTLPIADPVNALVFAPLTWIAGAPAAWMFAVAAHLLLAAVAADGLAGELGADPDQALVAGVAFGSAPVLLSSIHDASSEAIAVGLLPLALWATSRAMRGAGRASLAVAVGALALAGLANAYLAVATWSAALVLIASGSGEARRRGALALALATALVAPWDLAVVHAVTARDNVVGIKDPHELGILRRTTGAADPLSFVVPGDFRSPDFRKISRYGEDFIHCVYLGWVWMIAAAVGLRRRSTGIPAIWLVVGVTAALGPVLVHGGSAVLLPGNLGIPLPWFLVERLPGLSSLSLLFRFGVLSSLGVALLAAGATSGQSARVLALAGLLEVLLVSPMRGGPDASPLPDPAPFVAIASGPDGAVMNWPIEGGRPYLYEATLHGRPIAGTLNFAMNAASEESWRALRDAPAENPLRGAAVARRYGIRYLVVHGSGGTSPGPYDGVISALRAHVSPFAQSADVTVYMLW